MAHVSRWWRRYAPIRRQVTLVSGARSGSAAPDSAGGPGTRLFFVNGGEGVDARRRIAWPRLKGSGRRRVPRLGLRPDLPVMPLWPAPALALLATMACGVGGANSEFLEAMAAEISLILAAAILYVAHPPRLIAGDVAPVLGGLVAFLVWAALPGLLWPHTLLAPDRFWPAWLGDAGLVAAFMAAAVAGLRRKNAETFAIWLTVFTGVLIAGALALRLGGPALGWPFPLEDERLHRFAGSMGNPNAAGIAFTMLSLVALALARVLGARWVERPSDGLLLGGIGALAVALSGLALVGITQSRTALGLAVASLLVQQVTRKHRGRALRGWRLAASMTVVVCLMLAAGATLDRFTPVEADSVSRGAIWLHYLALAGRAPLAGYGLGAFAELNAQTLSSASAPMLWSFGAAHAAPVQLALEAGWPGLMVMGTVAVLVGRRVARLLRGRADPIGQAMVLAVLVALAAGMVDIALNVPGIALLASILLGLSWGRALRGGGWRRGA